MAQSLRRIIWSVVVVVGCHLVLWTWIQQSNSLEDAQNKASEVMPQTDIRALVTNGDLCTRMAHRKPRGPFTGKERWRGERLRQIVVESRKALYCSLGRIGCSRWRRLLMKADGFPLFAEELEAKPVSLKTLNVTRMSQIVEDNCYFRFVFIRDPFSRLLSAWHQMRQNYPILAKKYRKEGVIEGHQAVSPDFGEFVRTEAFVGNSSKWNEHWRPLIHFCGLTGSFDFDFIGRWEDRKTWMPLLVKRLGLEKEASSGWGPPTDHFFDTEIGSARSNSSERMEEFYTVELLDLVAQSYADDLQRFHYTQMYQSIRSKLEKNKFK